MKRNSEWLETPEEDEQPEDFALFREAYLRDQDEEKDKEEEDEEPFCLQTSLMALETAIAEETPPAELKKAWEKVGPHLDDYQRYRILVKCGSSPYVALPEMRYMVDQIGYVEVWRRKNMQIFEACMHQPDKLELVLQEGYVGQYLKNMDFIFFRLCNINNVDSVRVALKFGRPSQKFLSSILRDIENDGNLEMMQLLLENGADPNFTRGNLNDDWGALTTLLLEGGFRGERLPEISLYLAYGADSNRVVEGFGRHRTPLSLFAQRLPTSPNRNQIAILRLMMEHGGDLHKVVGGDCAMQIFANRPPDFIKSLIFGFSPNPPTGLGRLAKKKKKKKKNEW